MKINKSSVAVVVAALTAVPPLAGQPWVPAAHADRAGQTAPLPQRSYGGRQGKYNGGYAPDPYSGRTNFGGTVVRINSAYGMAVRGDDGNVYTVNSPTRITAGFGAGDRVQVSGTFANGVVSADGVTLVARSGGYQPDYNQGDYNQPDYNQPDYGQPTYNGGYAPDPYGNYGGRTNFGGTVVAIRSAYGLSVRGDDGTTYTVNSPTRISAGFAVGDRVQVSGTFTNGVVSADQVALVSRNGGYNQPTYNGGYAPAPAYGGRTTFGGTVAGIRSAYGLTVRADNGTSYTVNSPTRIAGAFAIGDRVQVSGTFTNGVVSADQVALVSRGGGYNQPGNRGYATPGDVQRVLGGLFGR